MVQSSPNTYFQKMWSLLVNTTWKWQKVKKYWKKRKKSFGGFWLRDLLTITFNNIFRTAFKQLENHTLKISSQFEKVVLEIFKTNRRVGHSCPPLPPPRPSTSHRVKITSQISVISVVLHFLSTLSSSNFCQSWNFSLIPCHVKLWLLLF